MSSYAVRKNPNWALVLEKAPEALPSLLREVEPSDQFWHRAANHFRLRLIRHCQRSDDNRGVFRLEKEQIPRISMTLADRLLWRLVPRKMRPEGWPKGEAEFAKQHQVSVFGLRLWMRLGRYHEVEAKVGPLWTEEEITKELVERLTERAFTDFDEPDPRNAQPRYAELALKARKVIGSDGKTVNTTLTVNKNEVNILGGKDEVFKLVQEVAQAARELGMGGEDGAAPRAVEVVASEVGGLEAAAEGREK